MQLHLTQQLTSDITSLVLKVFSDSGSDLKVLSTYKLCCDRYPRTRGAVETTPHQVHAKLKVGILRNTGPSVLMDLALCAKVEEIIDPRTEDNRMAVGIANESFKAF